MRLEEVSEWLQKYNSNNESVDLENEIEDRIRQKKFLTREDLITIVKWRFHKGSGKNRERAINSLEQMHGSEIEKITRDAFETEEESKKIRKLCKIKGVGISFASCILTFHNPKKYCVFNTHVYDEIFKIETRPSNFFSLPDYYLEMLDEIRKFSEKYDLTVSDVGKALFKKNRDESKSNNTRIKDISQDERPREKLERYGPDSLSNDELLALILRTGHQKENAIEMSNRLINEYGLDKLSDLALNELQEIKGIGFAKACQIIALFEFNKRHAISKRDEKPIKCANDVYEYALPLLSGKDKEHFMILHLDSKNRVIKDEIISIGTLNASLVHPREVFKSAIKESANAIVLVHNHPSGDAKPSKVDEDVTNRLNETGKLLKIKVIDHVIIGKDNYYSFRESQKLI
jgi:DNA repair protein RadC